MKDKKGRKILVGSWVRHEKEGFKNWRGTVKELFDGYCTVRPSNKDFDRTVRYDEIIVIRTFGRKNLRIN